MTPEALDIIFKILTSLSLVYLIFFKSYVEEKGKNLATKQDISEITNVVEVIRNNININSHNLITYNNEQRESLIEAFQRYSMWLQILVDKRLPSFVEFDEKYLSQYKIEISESFFNFKMARGKALLFNNNKALFDVLCELERLTTQLEGEVLYQLIYIDQNKKMYLIKLGGSISNAELFKEYNSKHISLGETYINTRSQSFRSINKLHLRYQHLTDNLIRDLFSQKTISDD